MKGIARSKKPYFGKRLRDAGPGGKKQLLTPISPHLTLSLKGEENKESLAAIILCRGYFFSFLGAGAASCLHMAPVRRSGALFGFAAGLHGLTAFVAGKDSHERNLPSG